MHDYSVKTDPTFLKKFCTSGNRSRAKPNLTQVLVDLPFKSLQIFFQDMTPEFKAEKAKKYNMLPEDYYPLSIQTAGNTGGDYPVVVEESYFCRPANYEWDNMQHRLNWGRPIGKYEFTRYGQSGNVFDGHYHPYGYWQYWQHAKIYFNTWFA